MKSEVSKVFLGSALPVRPGIWQKTEFTLYYYKKCPNFHYSMTSKLMSQVLQMKQIHCLRK